MGGGAKCVTCQNITYSIILVLPPEIPPMGRGLEDLTTAYFVPDRHELSMVGLWPSSSLGHQPWHDK